VNFIGVFHSANVTLTHSPDRQAGKERYQCLLQKSLASRRTALSTVHGANERDATSIEAHPRLRHYSHSGASHLIKEKRKSAHRASKGLSRRDPRIEHPKRSSRRLTRLSLCFTASRRKSSTVSVQGCFANVALSRSVYVTSSEPFKNKQHHADFSCRCYMQIQSRNGSPAHHIVSKAVKFSNKSNFLLAVYGKPPTERSLRNWWTRSANYRE